jgi:hypothetical protein
MFQYAWNRIYTTNIDNVLNVAYTTCHAKGLSSGDFEFLTTVIKHQQRMSLAASR